MGYTISEPIYIKNDASVRVAPGGIAAVIVDNDAVIIPEVSTSKETVVALKWKVTLLLNCGLEIVVGDGLESKEEADALADKYYAHNL